MTAKRWVEDSAVCVFAAILLALSYEIFIFPNMIGLLFINNFIPASSLLPKYHIIIVCSYDIFVNISFLLFVFDFCFYLKTGQIIVVFMPP